MLRAILASALLCLSAYQATAQPEKCKTLKAQRDCELYSYCTWIAATVRNDDGKTIRTFSYCRAKPRQVEHPIVFKFFKLSPSVPLSEFS